MTNDAPFSLTPTWQVKMMTLPYRYTSSPKHIPATRIWACRQHQWPSTFDPSWPRGSHGKRVRVRGEYDRRQHLENKLAIVSRPRQCELTGDLVCFTNRRREPGNRFACVDIQERSELSVALGGAAVVHAGHAVVVARERVSGLPRIGVEWQSDTYQLVTLVLSLSTLRSRSAI